MRVLLVSPNRTQINMRAAALGLGSVASAVRQAGHEIEVLDLLETHDIGRTVSEAVRRTRPEVIGVSLRNVDDQNMASPLFFLDEANAIMKEIKASSSAPVVLGGAGYSIFPGPALERSVADMGICGEGEEAFCKLLERIERKEAVAGVPGLYVRGKGLQGPRAFIRDLDRFPLPQPDLLPTVRGADAVLPVQTRRGCPLGCSYCSTASIEGTSIRRRSVESVVDWIAQWAGKGVRRLYFVDNTFNLPASYAHALCRRLVAASAGVSWTCIVYPRPIKEDLAALMAEAGCVEASLGFESGCERLLRAMRKRFRPEDVRAGAALLGRFGIRRMGFLLLGGPGETRDSVKESLAFADSLGLEALKVTIGVRIYPNTPLAALARTEGTLAPDDDLLEPRFYASPEIEGWVGDAVAAYAESRPHWIV